MDEPFLKRTRTTSPDQRDSITKDTNSLTINLDVLDEVKDSFPRPGSGLSKTRILILMSDTGGGHRASAQSLEAAFKELYGDRQEVLTVDIFCEWMRAPFNLFPEWYRYLQSNPCLWRALWFYGTCNCSRQLSEAHTYYQEAKRIQTRLLEINPDIIISVHPMVNDVMVRILQDLPEITAPYVTVVTDFGGAHRMWFSKGADSIYVPSDPIYQIGKKCGIEDEKLKHFGLPLRKFFWIQEDEKGVDVVDQKQLKAQLGLDPSCPSILLLSGGEGIGSLDKIAQVFSEKIFTELGPQGAQLVIVCGRNEKMKARLEAIQWEIPIRINGFVSNMHEWMLASDCIVTKAGPGTIAESLIVGLPIMLSSYLPGQETGNVTYVVENQVGSYSENPQVMAHTVCSWLKDPELLADMKQRAKTLGKPKATLEIARDIWNIHESIESGKSVLERLRIAKPRSLWKDIGFWLLIGGMTVIGIGLLFYGLHIPPFH